MTATTPRFLALLMIALVGFQQASCNSLQGKCVLPAVHLFTLGMHFFLVSNS